MSKRKFGILGMLFFILFSSCNLFAQSDAPYEIQASFVCEKNNSNYELGGLDCKFYNSSPKTVEKIILVFSLFDEDGIPILNKVMYEIGVDVGENEFIPFVLNIDEILKNTENKVTDVDFVYTSKIFYKDGSVWSDPFGIIYAL